MSNKPETVDQLFDYAIELERAAENYEAPEPDYETA